MLKFFQRRRERRLQKQLSNRTFGEINSYCDEVARALLRKNRDMIQLLEAGNKEWAADELRIKCVAEAESETREIFGLPDNWSRNP